MFLFSDLFKKNENIIKNTIKINAIKKVNVLLFFFKIIIYLFSPLLLRSINLLFSLSFILTCSSPFKE